MALKKERCDSRKKHTPHEWTKNLSWKRWCPGLRREGR